MGLFGVLHWLDLLCLLGLLMSSNGVICYFQCCKFILPGLCVCLSLCCYYIWLSLLNYIALYIMDNRTISINLDEWTSQAQYAIERGTSIQYINKLIREQKLDSLKIDELRLVLVKRPKVKSV